MSDRGVSHARPEAFLGQYQDNTFFSSDPAEVEAFCLANYENRTP